MLSFSNLSSQCIHLFLRMAQLYYFFPRNLCSKCILVASFFCGIIVPSPVDRSTQPFFPFSGKAIDIDLLILKTKAILHIAALPVLASFGQFLASFWSVVLPTELEKTRDVLCSHPPKNGFNIVAWLAKKTTKPPQHRAPPSSRRVVSKGGPARTRSGFGRAVLSPGRTREWRYKDRVLLPGGIELITNLLQTYGVRCIELTTIEICKKRWFNYFYCVFFSSASPFKQPCFVILSL